MATDLTRPNEETSGVAYVHRCFPSLTATFVYREVQALREAGVRGVNIACKRPQENEIHDEARPLVSETDYLPGLASPRCWGALVMEFLRRPIRFMRLAGKDLKIWHATMDDLKDIDIGSWFAPRYKEERVPTLGEVLEACKGKIGVNIELKYYGHDVQLEQRVADIVEAHGMASDVVIMSLKVGAVEMMKSIRPDWSVGLLLSVSAGDLKNVDVDFLAVNAKFCDRTLIRSAHKMDRDVYVWTVNDAATMSTMIGRGVDRLITDKPALARSVLAQRSRLSPPERLLLTLAEMLGVTPKIAEQ